jgi:single-strand DNA-binding protein
MASVNRVFIVGNIGSDPEVKFGQSGDAVAKFSVATTETWKDKNDEKQEKTEWTRVVAFGKLGEICGEYLKKGRLVCVEGKLSTSSWEDKDTKKKMYMTEVVARDVTFLGSPKDTSQDSDREPGEDRDEDEKRDTKKDNPRDKRDNKNDKRNTRR